MADEFKRIFFGGSGRPPASESVKALAISLDRYKDDRYITNEGLVERYSALSRKVEAPVFVTSPSAKSTYFF